MDLLPGLWLGCLALLLDRLLRRWYDPVPARVWALLGLLLLAFYGPVLTGGKRILPLDSLRGTTPFRQLAPTAPHGNLIQGDLIQLITPSRQLAGEAVGEGRWPLWNPRAGAGLPLLADPQAQVLQPLATLALPLAPASGAGVTAAARVLLAFVFTWLLLVRQGVGSGPATLGAVAWAAGGFLQLWLGWPLANTAAWLPAVLYGLVRCDGPYDQDGRDLRDRLLLAVALAGLLLAGHPETVLYALLLAALFLASRLRSSPAPRRLLRRVAGAGALAVAVTAPVWLPTVFYLPDTLRYHVLETAPEAPAPSIGEGRRLAQSLLPVVAPNTFGNSRYGQYWGRQNSNEDASGFGGTLTLLAAALALPGLAGRRRYPQERVMLAAAGAALLWLALPPSWSRSLAELPVLGVALVPGSHRPLLILGLALTYLAACSLARWRDGEVSRARLLLPATALAAVLAVAYWGYGDPADPANLDVLRRGWLHWQGRFLLFGATLLWFGQRRRWVAPALALLVAAELFLAFHDTYPPMPKRLEFPAPAPLGYLARHAEAAGGGRMAGLGEALPPNLASLYGLADARVYNPVEPAAYAGLLGPLLEAPRVNVPRLAVADHPVLDLLGVDLLLTDPGVVLAPPLELRLEDSAGWVYYRPGALPRLFLPATAAVLDTSGADPFAAVDFRRLAALPAGSPGVPWRATRPEASRLSDLRLSPVHISARADLAERRLLASSIYRQSDGWRLLVDGRATATFEANGPLLAAWLPPGRHRLDLLYRPPGFLAGCLLAALGLVAAVLGVGPPSRTGTSRGPRRE